MEIQWSARLEQWENIPSGCSKSSSSKAAASEGPEAYPLGYVESLNDARTKLADFFSILLETQETAVYNALHGEVFVSPVECRWSGGLAQLGEHYVRNVGVGGSTPLPSTKPSSLDPEPIIWFLATG